MLQLCDGLRFLIFHLAHADYVLESGSPNKPTPTANAEQKRFLARYSFFSLPSLTTILLLIPLSLRLIIVVRSGARVLSPKRSHLQKKEGKAKGSRILSQDMKLDCDNKHGECVTEINGGVRKKKEKGACKFLRRKCQPECAFAPYFPPDQPQKFANVHRIFGASNVTKLLNDLHPHQREDAVNSLAYEAEMRLRDPVYGCVGVISLLQHQLRQLQMDLYCAKSELSRYQNLSTTTNLSSLASESTATTYHHHQNTSGGGGFSRDHHYHYHHHHQFFPRDQHQQQQVVKSFDAGNNYDASLLAMNISASLGQLNQLQHQSATGGGDDRNRS
ncbi:Protein ASYMMETRIC LEAVES 2 [Glycine max]|nr:Protein ASYMMETRIC LEAVES 2 [Glycine max]